MFRKFLVLVLGASGEWFRPVLATKLTQFGKTLYRTRLTGETIVWTEAIINCHQDGACGIAFRPCSCAIRDRKLFWRRQTYLITMHA